MAASYEVTDGTRILGTFSSQSKSDALKKELKAQGVKARVRIVHEEPKGRKSKSAPDAPRKPVKAKKTARSNPVPKKTSKTPQKPKETPKTGKAVDANAPKDYKGPLIPAEDIREMFAQHVYCTEVETGITSEVMIKYGTVSVMEKGRNGYDLKAVYTNSEVESDGKYLRVTYKGVDHWFVIHADEKVSAPFVVRRRPAVDYSTCSIEQLADVLYQIQEVHVTNRRWYDRDAPHEPNPVLSRDEILNALTTPEKAVALCDAYLHCYVSSYSEFWGGWDENTISYSDWKAIEKRLAKIRADAKKAIPSEPPAPVEKPKRGLFKKKTESPADAPRPAHVAGPGLKYGEPVTDGYELETSLIPNGEIVKIFANPVKCAYINVRKDVDVQIRPRTPNSVIVTISGEVDGSQEYPLSDIECDGTLFVIHDDEYDLWFRISGWNKAPLITKPSPNTDYSVCDVHVLADTLCDIQDYQVSKGQWYNTKGRSTAPYSRAEVHAALTDPTKTVDLCNVFIQCIERYSRTWGGWNGTLSPQDWKAIEERLNALKAEAISYLEGNAPEGPFATVGKTKKGLFKKKTKSGLEARADTYRRLNSVLEKAGVDIVPVSRSNFNLVCPDPSCGFQIRSMVDKSLFDLPDEPESTEGIRLSDVIAHMDSYFDADGNPIPARLKAAADSTFKEPRFLGRDRSNAYTVDASALRTELARANRILGKGKFKKLDGKDNVRLMARGGDLILCAESDSRTSDGRSKYGMNVDVGDGPESDGGIYVDTEQLRLMMALMSASDGPFVLKIEERGHLVAESTIGHFDVALIMVGYKGSL